MESSKLMGRALQVLTRGVGSLEVMLMFLAMAWHGNMAYDIPQCTIDRVRGQGKALIQHMYHAQMCPVLVKGMAHVKNKGSTDSPSACKHARLRVTNGFCQFH